MPIKIVKEPFSISGVFWYRKVYGKERAPESRFPGENVLSHCTEIFHTTTFCVSEFFSSRKFSWLWGVYQDFLGGICYLTVPKNLLREPFSVPLFSTFEKLFASQGQVTILRRKFFVSQCPNISRRRSSVFQKKSDNEIVNPSLGITRFSIEKLLSQSSERLRRETLLCCVLGNFRCQKFLQIRDGKERDYQDLASNFFCLTLSKKVVGEPFGASLFLGIEKFCG